MVSSVMCLSIFAESRFLFWGCLMERFYENTLLNRKIDFFSSVIFLYKLSVWGAKAGLLGLVVLRNAKRRGFGSVCD